MIKNFKKFKVVVVSFTIFFMVSQPALAIVPVFDAFASTQRTAIIGNQVIQSALLTTANLQIAALNTMTADIHFKEIGIPTVWPPSPTAALPCLAGGFSLDCIAWLIGKTLLHAISQQIIGWIQGGNGTERFFDALGENTFLGGPLFVTNWEEFLINAADTASGYFINELELTELCEPFRIPIQRQARSYIFGKGQPLFESARCTITDIIGNLQTFYGDFHAGGGWAMWEMTSQIPANNPYIVEMIVAEERTKRVVASILKNRLEASASEGFLGDQRCESIPFLGKIIGEDCDIVTPGQTIEEQLRDVFGSQIDQLNIADELDEILFALLQQLLSSMTFDTTSGGVLKTPVVPTSTADTDGDGVLDANDRCQGTPLGTPVGIDGCPLGLPPPPAPAPAPAPVPAPTPPPPPPSSDTTPPTVSLTFPSQTISGSETFTATASDNVGIGSVSFLLDGINIGSDTTGPPYSITFDTTSLTNAIRTLTAEATDTSGNKTLSTGVQVTINNDTTNPTISLSLPTDGQLVTQPNQAVSAIASDTGGSGISSVEFFVDSVPIGTDSIAPYLVLWDTTSLVSGSSHTVSSIATDNAGNTASSVTVIVFAP